MLNIEKEKKVQSYMFAGEVRHQFELLDYQIPIAHILDKVGFKIYKENLSANISGFIGVSDS